jgi:hypothetical protein
MLGDLFSVGSSRGRKRNANSGDLSIPHRDTDLMAIPELHVRHDMVKLGL